MSEVPLYPLSGDGVELDPGEDLGRSWGLTVQGLLEIKNTHRP